MKSICGKICDIDNTTPIGHYLIEYSGESDNKEESFIDIISKIPRDFIRKIIELFENAPNKLREYINYTLRYHRVTNNEISLNFKDYDINIKFSDLDQWNKVKSVMLCNTK